MRPGAVDGRPADLLVGGHVQVDEAGQGDPGDSQRGGISLLTATMAQSGEPHLPPHDVKMIGRD